MTIDVWRKDTLDSGDLKPSTLVFTMRLESFSGQQIRSNLCDLAWTSEAETMTHFWYSAVWMASETKTPVRMTLGEYIAAHVREVSAMNPFWALGRMEFLAEWRKRNP